MRFAYKHDTEIVGRHIDNLCKLKSARTGKLDDGFKITQTPSGITRSQLDVECLIARCGMAAEPAIRPVKEQHSSTDQDPPSHP
jgi:hypothetical protein